MIDAPTERQVQILAVIRERIAEYGEGPTVREIGARVGLSSTGSVAYQLRRMEESCMIRRTSRSGRSLRLGP